MNKKLSPKIFGKVWTIYVENVDQKINFLYDSDETEIRLPFYKSVSTFWNQLGGFSSQDFYSSAWGKK